MHNLLILFAFICSSCADAGVCDYLKDLLRKFIYHSGIEERSTDQVELDVKVISDISQRISEQDYSFVLTFEGLTLDTVQKLERAIEQSLHGLGKPFVAFNVGEVKFSNRMSTLYQRLKQQFPEADYSTPDRYNPCGMRCSSALRQVIQVYGYTPDNKLILYFSHFIPQKSSYEEFSCWARYVIQMSSEGEEFESVRVIMTSPAHFNEWGSAQGGFDTGVRIYPVRR